LSLPGASRRVLGLSLSAGTVRLTIYDAMANLAHSYPAVKQVGIQSKSAGLYGYGSRYDPSGCQGAGILSRHAERFSDSTTKGDGWVDVNKSGGDSFTRLVETVGKMFAEGVDELRLPQDMKSRLRGIIQSRLTPITNTPNAQDLGGIGLDQDLLDVENDFLTWIGTQRWPVKKRLEAVDVVLDSLSKVFPVLHGLVEIKHLVQIVAEGPAQPSGSDASGPAPAAPGIEPAP
jgi:hypothetical protein